MVLKMAYESKWNEIQVTFTLKKSTCPPAHLNNKQLTQTDDVKYLDIHLDRKLTLRKHVSTKRKQLALKTPQIVLGHWPKIAVITGKQAAGIQSTPEIYLDLWCTIVGISIKL